MIVIGTDVESNRRIEIPDEAREAGFYIIGRRGMGKSTLMEALIARDIEAGHGVGVFDPHGTLIDAVMSRIPDERLDDVVYLDAGDKMYPFGLNLFELHSDDEDDVTRAVDQVVQTFKKVWGIGEDASWGPLLEDLLSNITHTLIESQGYTLTEIPALLYKPKFRQSVVDSLSNWVVQDFWQYEWDPLNNRQQIFDRRSTTNKVRAFLRDPVIRNIVGQVESTIDFAEIMDEEKILLVRLEHGVIGETAASLLGSMMIGQILMAALNREPSRDTPMFYLYADEFQRFATPAFGTLIDETRKYRIATTIAHQRRSQLDWAYQEMARGAVNYMIFQVNADDAEEFAGEFRIDPQPGELIAKPKMESVYSTTYEDYWDPPEAEGEYAAARARLSEISSIKKRIGLRPARVRSAFNNEIDGVTLPVIPSQSAHHISRLMNPNWNLQDHSMVVGLIKQAVEEQGSIDPWQEHVDRWLRLPQVRRVPTVLTTITLDEKPANVLKILPYAKGFRFTVTAPREMVICSSLQLGYQRNDDPEFFDPFTKELQDAIQRAHAANNRYVFESDLTDRTIGIVECDGERVLAFVWPTEPVDPETLQPYERSFYQTDVVRPGRATAFNRAVVQNLHHSTRAVPTLYPEAILWVIERYQRLQQETQQAHEQLDREEVSLKRKLESLTECKKRRIHREYLYELPVKAPSGIVNHWDEPLQETVYEYVPGPPRPIADIRNELVSRLANLPPRNIALRLGAGAEVTQAFVEIPEIIPTERDEWRIQQLIEASRERYCRPRAQVEQEIAKRRRRIDQEPSEPEPAIHDESPIRRVRIDDM